MLRSFRLGIDVGSTTVKIVALDGQDNIVYKDYRRHCSAVEKVLLEMLAAAGGPLAAYRWQVALTGSAALAMARETGLPFIQEVVAGTTAVRSWLPAAKTVVELGGEDAKITFFSPSLEQRMNGVCAGGTGSFIDQMAALLGTDPAGLDRLAAGHRQIYPIASRCGVFAKTDVQALLNEGVDRADVAASVLQAVGNQTITSLAQGRKNVPPLALLGGPLYFLPELRQRFRATLNLTGDQCLTSAEGLFFVGLGAALNAGGDTYSWPQLVAMFSRQAAMPVREGGRLAPLFTGEDEYELFSRRHRRAGLATADLRAYCGPAYLGIDAGSTTTKLVLLGEDGQLLYSHYSSNCGEPLATVRQVLLNIYDRMNEQTYIAHATVTGYGERLLKAALAIDSGEVETVAHLAAARYFSPDVSFIIDIGGQDMKCLAVEDGAIRSVVLNEACSAGCGSFIETFAASLGLTLPQFVARAVSASRPVDLGTRCTVFMNSKVKQAQKEGADVGDICAGIAISVVRNALYKVLRLRDTGQMGGRIVVQGGTFLNDAVLRAFEQQVGREVVRPVVAGLMGALGAALLARQRADGRRSALAGREVLSGWQQNSVSARCTSCANRCRLTRHRFSDGRSFVSGNRCERGEGNYQERSDLPDLYREKFRLLFGRAASAGNGFRRGQIGLPRVLNMYEDFPFWHRLFDALGYQVVVSSPSSPDLYARGMDSIPSETLCYPAKLVHGHVADLVERGVRKIFYPCLVYADPAGTAADNHYNCPVVASYPENIRANMEILAERGVVFYQPFLPLHDKRALVGRLLREMAGEGWRRGEVERAVRLASAEQQAYRAAVQAAGDRALAYMRRHGLRGIVLAGRPYHVDPAINHGLSQLITGLGLVVLSEDSVCHLAAGQRRLRVVDQWEYHSRLYAAAEFVAGQPDLQMVQLNSFGCGLDAITVDQVEEILSAAGKLSTVIKLDDIANLGAARIRIRSLLAAFDGKTGRGRRDCPVTVQRHYQPGFTVLAPEMSPLHTPFVSAAFARYGHRLVIPDFSPEAVDLGLKYVHNDACYPALLVIGQLLQALNSGRYDRRRTAVILSQTCGSCRATNYLSLLKKALADAGLADIPVLSLSRQGAGRLGLGIGFVRRAVQGIVIGDLMQRLVYRTRPSEEV
ncbi:MAG: acyl-CoA dehydratase activase-related protein, partial [Negativicutes bacterium]|nr:acyl-CoA dehydratase activase-related protein [Negativicutes bacterium]